MPIKNGFAELFPEITAWRRDFHAHPKASARSLMPIPRMGGARIFPMCLARKGAYIFLGNGDSEMVHHPSYVFDDNVIP